ncbi:MAG: MmcQ/YjbR family DNA-binding protein [Terricaulis sp.]
MTVTAAKARKLALSLEGVSEAPHFDRAAFRTKRIFATLANSGSDINFMFDPPLQEFYCAQSAAMSPVPGGWGKQGATRCDLKKVDEATFLSALKAAHARGYAPRRKRPVAKKIKATQARSQNKAGAGDEN